MTLQDQVNSWVKSGFKDLPYRRDYVAMRDVRYMGLKQIGWTRSYEESACVGTSGEPVPWFTYSATEWLEQFAPLDSRVLEVGCGASTVWWLRRGGSVVGVETDSVWVDRIQAQLTETERARCKITVVPNAEGARRVIDAAASKELFDVVVNDGVQPRGELAIAP